jgi:ABC-2 type transport system ATP-binding protein
LFSSHQLDLVEQYCDDVVIIDRGTVVAAGAVGELTLGSPPVLVVGIGRDGSRAASEHVDDAWARTLPGVTVSSTEGGRFRLALSAHTDPQTVLAAAQAVGPITNFSFERRRLSEVFLDAVRARRP